MRFRKFFLALLLCAISACTRPLTEAETAFAEAVIGPGLETDRIKVADNFALFPPRRQATYSYRPAKIGSEPCVRRPRPSGNRTPPAAVAFQNTLFMQGPLYSANMVEGWPDRLRVPHALVFAHELVHVWQWQNRAETGYSPWRAAGEGLRAHDPYFFELSPDLKFEGFGYEQQAALLEDYLCFRVANPNHPRAAALREILAPVFPLDALDAALNGQDAGGE